MKILFVHNKYQQVGGEDGVFEAESNLMEEYGHRVKRLVFDNRSIQTLAGKVSSGIGVIYNVRSARVLRAVIEEFNPDIIHVHNFFPLVSPSVFCVAKEYALPVVVTLHNYRLICPGFTLYYDNRIDESSIHSLVPLKAIWKRVYRNSALQTAATVAMTAFHSLAGTWKNKVDKYIVLTQFAKSKFGESIFPAGENQFVVKPNFVFDHGAGEENRENFFLFVGRLTKEKGVEVVLEAARLYGFSLTIIGDGPLREMVERFARENSNICYSGFQPKKTILDVMKRCQALIVPSLWYEGFPLTILEAFCTGTPVIASRLGGMREIVEDGINGLHFEPGNVAQLAQRVNQVTKQPELAMFLSDNARQTYLNRYTPAKNYEMLRRIYGGLLNSTNSPGVQQGMMRAFHYPRVSIGIPTYNSSSAILHTVESILAQQYPNIEIIISDNASLDNTHTVCDDICRKCPQVKYFRQEKNIGMLANFQFVLDRADGKYFMWVSDDDRLEPGALFRYVWFLERNLEYVLVSGKIRYWLGDEFRFNEADLNFEQQLAGLRAIAYYFKVINGGMYHGLMRRDAALRTKVCNAIGADWHFVSSLAYMGKIKNFNFTGYNKRLGGSSNDFRKYVKVIGDSPFAASFPHVKIACDAFRQIFYDCPVYKDSMIAERFGLALSAFAAVLAGYYLKLYPLIVGGRLRRFFSKCFSWKHVPLPKTEEVNS